MSLVIPQIGAVLFMYHVTVRFVSRSNSLKTSFRLYNVILAVFNNFFEQANGFFNLSVDSFIEFILYNNNVGFLLSEAPLHWIKSLST
jgi:hypothetical protein